MYDIQFDLYKNFIPPVSENLFSYQNMNRLLSNLLTGGIRATIENVEHQYRICELEKERALLLEKFIHFEASWKLTHQHLTKLLDETIAWKEEEDDDQQERIDLKEKIQQLSQENEKIEEKLSQNQTKDEFSFQFLIKKIFCVFTAIVQWPSDLFSLGFARCYQNYLLRNRIKVFKAQNEHLENQFASFQTEYQSFFQKNIDLLKQNLEMKQDLLGIQQTDPGKAYFEMSHIKQELQKLKDQEKDLQQEYKKLDILYKITRETENQLKQSLSDELNNKIDLQDQILKEQNEQKILREEIQQMTDLQKRIGPFDPKYKPEENELKNLLEEYEDFSSSYIERYKGLCTAADLFKKGFSYALSAIFTMIEKEKDKIKLNRSLGTPVSKSAQIVYRYLALDWVEGGKVVLNCHDYYELYLNDKNLKLVPSLPEKVLKYKKNVEGKFEPIISIHFQARDDFIPEEDVLKHTPAACGIDPIAAKCLLVQLNEEEYRHFLNLLWEPAMEDHQPDYLAALNFIEKLSKKKQDAIYLLRDLIADIGVALEAKFKQDFAMIEWEKYLDVEDLKLQPFVKEKEENDNFSPLDLEDQELFPWTINCNNLIFASEENSRKEQSEFLQTILHVQEVYKIYFSNLSLELLQEPMTPAPLVQDITWMLIQKQYYKCHNMIGNHGCLFSNLLTVLMVDKADLHEQNIVDLKKAMAAYLDDPSISKQFQSAIMNDFRCTMKEFQQWLRGEGGAPCILLNELTPVIIQIAAYTLGVRFVLFSPSNSTYDYICTKGKVDHFGRLVPAIEDMEGHYFGPPTQEMFFMAVENNHTYYGLFPKLKIASMNPKTLGMSTDNFNVMKKLDDYWQSIRL